jgi:hypothetical protein
MDLFSEDKYKYSRNFRKTEKLMLQRQQMGLRWWRRVDIRSAYATLTTARRVSTRLVRLGNTITRLRIHCPKGCVGSTPAFDTKPQSHHAVD